MITAADPIRCRRAALAALAAVLLALCAPLSMALADTPQRPLPMEGRKTV